MSNFDDPIPGYGGLGPVHIPDQPHEEPIPMGPLELGPRPPEQEITMPPINVPRPRRPRTPRSMTMRPADVRRGPPTAVQREAAERVRSTFPLEPIANPFEGLFD